MIKLLILLLIPISMSGQNVRIMPIAYKCDSGWSWMPSLRTSSLYIEADTCLPDNVCKKFWKEYEMSLCGEASYLIFNEKGYLHSHTNEWSDSLGCKSIDEYRMKVKKKWVKIARQKYLRLTGQLFNRNDSEHVEMSGNKIIERFN